MRRLYSRDAAPKLSSNPTLGIGDCGLRIWDLGEVLAGLGTVGFAAVGANRSHRLQRLIAQHVHHLAVRFAIRCSQHLRTQAHPQRVHRLVPLHRALLRLPVHIERRAWNAKRRTRNESNLPRRRLCLGKERLPVFFIFTLTQNCVHHIYSVRRQLLVDLHQELCLLFCANV